MKILVLNAGSSSHKISLFEFAGNLPDDPLGHVWEARIEWHGETADTVVRSSSGPPRRAQSRVSSRVEAVEDLVATLWSGDSPVVTSPADISVVGHRIVHGGEQYEEPVRITPAVKSGIASVSAFAPLHNRAELEGIERVSIAKFLRLRRHIPAPTNGSVPVSDATDSTVSTISIARGAPHNFLSGT